MKLTFTITTYFFYTAIMLLLCSSFLFSCEKKTDKEAIQELIEETAQKRLDDFRRIRMKRCWQDVMEEASRVADSILLEEARLRRDTLLKPPKPDKPDKPEIKTLLDSTPIKPFLANESLDSTAIRDSLNH